LIRPTWFRYAPRSSALLNHRGSFSVVE
jgi:hypothetical protein